MELTINNVVAQINQLQVQLSELVQLPDLSVKELNYLYNLAVTKCQVGDYQGALPLFQFLVLAARANDLYIKGLAGANHGAGLFRQASELYQMVFQRNPQLQVDCLFYMADCALNESNPELAKQQLTEFISQTSQDSGQDPVLLKRAKLLLGSLQA